MAKVNKTSKKPIKRTHEGARAKNITPEMELRRSVMSCLLWENEFYEDGQEISNRIAKLVPQVDARRVASIAVEARTRMNLRHVPLLITREMARKENKLHNLHVANTLEDVIQRADELTEFLAIYWKEGRQPLSAQVKKGLASAFPKFDAYQLAKYDRDAAVKLRDVLFLCHARPANAEQSKLWKQLINGTLSTPDTWEVNLSAGKDKKETFERLLRERKLGGLALLRNLRNMHNSGVDEKLVFGALDAMRTDRILPFRFIAAANNAPQWESHIEKAMMKNLANQDKLPGKTVILVDVSGSMTVKLSNKSDLSRMDAACGLAMLVREICDDAVVISFSNNTKLIPARHGFALRDAIVGSQPHGGTYLGGAISKAKAEGYDRIIVITDEQSHDRVDGPLKDTDAYMINVASYKNGVGYGDWVHIDGFSESIIDYIRAYESLDNLGVYDLD